MKINNKVNVLLSTLLACLLMTGCASADGPEDDIEVVQLTKENWSEYLEWKEFTVKDTETENYVKLRSLVPSGDVWCAAQDVKITLSIQYRYLNDPSQAAGEVYTCQMMEEGMEWWEVSGVDLILEKTMNDDVYSWEYLETNVQNAGGTLYLLKQPCDEKTLEECDRYIYSKLGRHLRMFDE